MLSCLVLLLQDWRFLPTLGPKMADEENVASFHASTYYSKEKKECRLAKQDLATLDLEKVTPMSPEVISRQATINIGTIGHVAHGKSTVVRAISGVKTVRFKKELVSNITIKLGYANAKIFQCEEMEKPDCYFASGCWPAPSPQPAVAFSCPLVHPTSVFVDWLPTDGGRWLADGTWAGGGSATAVGGKPNGAQCAEGEGRIRVLQSEKIERVPQGMRIMFLHFLYREFSHCYQNYLHYSEQRCFAFSGRASHFPPSRSLPTDQVLAAAPVQRFVELC